MSPIRPEQEVISLHFYLMGIRGEYISILIFVRCNIRDGAVLADGKSLEVYRWNLRYRIVIIFPVFRFRTLAVSTNLGRVL